MEELGLKLRYVSRNCNFSILSIPDEIAAIEMAGDSLTIIDGDIGMFSFLTTSPSGSCSVEDSCGLWALFNGTTSGNSFISAMSSDSM